MTICNEGLHFTSHLLPCPAHLHPQHGLVLDPHLSFLDIVLGEVQWSVILEHVRHQLYEVLHTRGRLDVNVACLVVEGIPLYFISPVFAILFC